MRYQLIFTRMKSDDGLEPFSESLEDNNLVSILLQFNMLVTRRYLLDKTHLERRIETLEYILKNRFNYDHNTDDDIPF